MKIHLLTTVTLFALTTTFVAAEERLSFQSQSHLQGIAKPKLLAELPAATAGVVSKVHVEENQLVRQGDPLVTLDDRVAKAAQKVAAVSASRTAALRSARLKFKLAERQLGRMKEAHQRQATSNFEVEEKQTARDLARADYDRALEDHATALANLELATAELRRLTLHAPFDGRVVEVKVNAGTAVDAVKPIVTVANVDVLEVTLFLPVERFGSINDGDTVELLADAPVNRTLVGQVRSVSPIINAVGRTFRCVVTIDNHDHALPGGFSVMLQTSTSVAQLD